MTDADEGRLTRAEQLFPLGGRNGVDLRFVNPTKTGDAIASLKALSGGDGYDDVFVYAPSKALLEQASALLGRDGCLNFFAGPTDTGFTAPLNYYDIHYGSTHVIGTTGGNTDDMRESLRLTAAGRIHPAAMVTHIGGLDSAAGATLSLADLPGGKKLIYTHIDMPLTPLDTFGEKAKEDPRFGELAALVARENGLWNLEAERYLLANW